METEKMSEPLEIPPLLRQEVIHERKQKDARIAELEAQLAAAQEEIERMRPIVDAAKRLIPALCQGDYTKQEKETYD
jgi:hypothetical protein